MKTQISRNSYQPGKGYSGVFQQMGRMITDADWNEQSQISRERLVQALQDVIGSGTPEQGGLVQLDHNTGRGKLQWGKVYVDGLMASVEPDSPEVGKFAFDRQRDFPVLKGTVIPDNSKVYIDVWEREVTYLEDSSLRDTALQGADTCSRTKTMAQVKFCLQDDDPMNPAVNPPKGNTLLTIKLKESEEEKDPCDACGDAIKPVNETGNYLFRLEVHDVAYDEGGELQKVILKWSSENGAEARQSTAFDISDGFKRQDAIYEFFSSANDAEKLQTEKHLGHHFTAINTLATCGKLFSSNEELLYQKDDQNPGTSIRRWDGWCRLKLNQDGNWHVTSGQDHGIRISNEVAAGNHGYTTSTDQIISIELAELSLTLAIKDRVLNGDYWQTTVRSTNTRSEIVCDNKEPDGIEHHYLLLGTWTGNGSYPLVPSLEQAARPFEFVPLTKIKEATENTLSRHNRYLHGWGIVCGYILECHRTEEGNDQQHIKISSGYALDSEGHEIELQNNEGVLLDISDTEVRKHLDESGNGSVAVILDSNNMGQPIFRFEKHIDGSTDVEFSEKSIWDDFNNNCMGKLGALFGEKFGGLNFDQIDAYEKQHNIHISHDRKILTSLFNLFVDDLFVSQKEHELLKELYENFKATLKESTYCGVIKNTEEFPKYPFKNRKAKTWFTKGGHSEMYLDPTGKWLFTWGKEADNNLHIFDTEKGELIAVESMPVEDQNYQISSVCMENSVFYVAVLQNGDTNTQIIEAQLSCIKPKAGVDILGHTEGLYCKIEWNKEHHSRLFCQRISNIYLLKSGYEDTQNLEDFFFTVDGKGIYNLSLEELFDRSENIKPPEPWISYNLYGDIFFDYNNGKIYSRESLNPSSSGQNYSFVTCSFMNDTIGKLSYPRRNDSGLSINGTDRKGFSGLDINKEGIQSFVFTIVEGRSGRKSIKKGLLIANRGGEEITLNTPHEITLDKYSDAAVTLFEGSLYKADYSSSPIIAITYANTNAINVLLPKNSEAVKGGFSSTYTPVQNKPSSVVVDSHQALARTLVLNKLSNTITEIPISEIIVKQDYLIQLKSYRDKVLNLFTGLYGHLFQYLKDCFCHQLLVKCPTFEKRPIYLGTIEIRNNQLNHVCNFEKRRYVKTFPTIQYWMSLFPYEAMIKQYVQQLCHWMPTVATEDGTAGDDNAVPTPKLKQEQIIPANNLLFKGDGLQMLSDSMAQDMKLQGELMFDKLKPLTNPAAIIPERGINIEAYRNAPIDQAANELGRLKLNVKREEYNSTQVRRYLNTTRTTPKSVEEGANVTLVERDGKVMFYIVDQPQEMKVAEVPEHIKKEVQDLEQRKTELGEQLNQLREQEQGLNKSIRDLITLQQTIQPEIQNLTNSVKELQSVSQEMTINIERNRSVSRLDGITPALVDALRERDIITIADLAKANSNDLARSRIKVSDEIINDARVRAKIPARRS